MTKYPLAALAMVSLAVACGTLRADEPNAVDSVATPVDLLRHCRDMLPTRPLELSGAIVLRNRRGIPLSQFEYRLDMDRTTQPARLTVRLYEKGTTNLLERVSLARDGKMPEGSVRGTDVQWADLAFDFLWWPKAFFEAEREGETMHGQKCVVILAENGATEPKKKLLWIEKKYGAVMQVEDLDADGRPVRRMWGTRLKKFGERWMANVIEVETLGAKQRTKITVDDIKEK